MLQIACKINVCIALLIFPFGFHKTEAALGRCTKTSVTGDLALWSTVEDFTKSLETEDCLTTDKCFLYKPFQSGGQQIMKAGCGQCTELPLQNWALSAGLPSAMELFCYTYTCSGGVEMCNAEQTKELKNSSSQGTVCPHLGPGATATMKIFCGDATTKGECATGLGRKSASAKYTAFLGCKANCDALFQGQTGPDGKPVECKTCQPDRCVPPAVPKQASSVLLGGATQPGVAILAVLICCCCAMMMGLS